MADRQTQLILYLAFFSLAGMPLLGLQIATLGVIYPLVILALAGTQPTIIGLFAAILAGVLGVMCLLGVMFSARSSKTLFKVFLFLTVLMGGHVWFYVARTPQEAAVLFAGVNAVGGITLLVLYKKVLALIEEEIKQTGEVVDQEIRERYEREIIPLAEHVQQQEATARIQQEIQEIYKNNPPDKAEELLKKKQEEWATRR